MALFHAAVGAAGRMRIAGAAGVNKPNLAQSSATQAATLSARYRWADLAADDALTFGKGDFITIPNMQNNDPLSTAIAGTISGFNVICGTLWQTVNDGTAAGNTGGIAQTTICSFGCRWVLPMVF